MGAEAAIIRNYATYKVERSQNSMAFASSKMGYKLANRLTLPIIALAATQDMSFDEMGPF